MADKDFIKIYCPKTEKYLGHIRKGSEIYCYDCKEFHNETEDK